MDNLGKRLRQARLRAGLSLRELARRADVSASLISLVENGKSQPSVGTLYALARILDVSVDDLFVDDLTPDLAEVSAQPVPVPTRSGPAASEGVRADLQGRPIDPIHAWQPSEYATRISVEHPTHRARLSMADGVLWERLAATPEQGVNFMKIVYEPGAASTIDGEPVTHHGYEYGYVVSGALELTVGTERFVLQAGESVGFDSTIPHVLHNPGRVPFEGIWFVHVSHPAGEPL